MPKYMPAAVMIVVFACFAYIALSDTVHVLELGQFGSVFVLLLCVIASAGWIAFLAALALANGPDHTSSFRRFLE